MARIVTISGSPSPFSRTKAVVEYIKDLPVAKGWQTDTIAIRALPPEVLANARFDSPPVRNTVRLPERAEGVVIAAPVQQGLLRGAAESVSGLASPGFVGESRLAHPLARLPVIDYALKPVLLFALGAQKRAERRLSAGKPDPPVSGSDSAAARGGRAPPGAA